MFEKAPARIPILTPLLAVACAACVVSCVPKADLTPSPQARRVGVETAISEVNGVRVEAETDAWPGLESVTGHVTPIRVVVRNDSDKAIRLRYNDFALIASEGRRYAAVPPFGVTGTVQEPQFFSRTYRPVDRPSFGSYRFSVAPYYSTMYPTIVPYSGIYFYDSFYYGTYNNYWTAIPLPTQGMLEWGLPEGVIEPGGHVKGFLYFERVEPDEPSVLFRADLVTDEGKYFGEARIPFDVEPEVEQTARQFPR